MNRLIAFPLQAVNEVLKTIRMLTDAATVRRYMDGWADGYTLGVEAAIKESCKCRS